MLDKQLAACSWPALGALERSPSFLRPSHPLSLLYYDLQENQVAVKHYEIKPPLFGRVHLLLPQKM